MKKRLREARRACRFALVRAAFEPLCWLPRGAALGIMGMWGRLAFVTLAKPRRKMESNLRLVFPDWSLARRRRFARSVLVHLGRNILDFVRLRRMSAADIEAIVRCAHIGRLERALRRGRGVVVVTGHVGNWELMAAYFASRGYPVSVVARRHREEIWDRWIRRLRERHGVKVLDRSRNGVGIVRALKRGEVVGLLLDQATSVESIRVPFLGREAKTPVGPVRLARRTGAAIVPMVIQMEGRGVHTITVGREIPVANGSSNGVAETTQRCNQALEELIMQHPEQWVWFHERWD